MTMHIVILVILLLCLGLQSEGRSTNQPELLEKLTSSYETGAREVTCTQSAHKRHHGSFISGETETTETSIMTKESRLSSTTESTTFTSMVNEPAIEMYRGTDPNTVLDEWDERLAWRLPFGDPRRPLPETTNDYNKFCQIEQNITQDIEVKFYNQLYPENVIVQKVGHVLAKVDKEFIKAICTAEIFKFFPRSISELGFSANMGARYSKIHRDAFVENLMLFSSYPENSKMSTLICVIDFWAMKTLAKYPDQHYLREFMIDSIGKIVSEVTKVLQEQTNTIGDKECELDLLTTKSKEKAPKSLQLLVLKVVNSLTKIHHDLT